jgi:hypothetical protein
MSGGESRRRSTACSGGCREFVLVATLSLPRFLAVLRHVVHGGPGEMRMLLISALAVLVGTYALAIGPLVGMRSPRRGDG